MWGKRLFHLSAGVSLVLYCTFLTHLGHMIDMVSLDRLSDIYT